MYGPHPNQMLNMARIPQGQDVIGPQPFLASNGQSSFNAVPLPQYMLPQQQQHPYMTPQYPSMAPQHPVPQHPFMAPQHHQHPVPQQQQQHAYVAPQHPCMAHQHLQNPVPQQSHAYKAPHHPCMAPQQHKNLVPKQQHAYGAPQHPCMAHQHLQNAVPQQSHAYVAPRQHQNLVPQQQHAYGTPQQPCMAPQQHTYSNQDHNKYFVPISDANNVLVPQKNLSSIDHSSDKSLIRSFFQGNPVKALDQIMDLKPSPAVQAPFQSLEPMKIPAGTKSGECRRMLTRDGNYIELIKWGPEDSDSSASQGKK